MIGDISKHIRKIPIEEAIKPKNGECLVNRYWSVQDGCILFYNNSPQCNADQAVARVITDKLYPQAEVILIPEVYI